MVKDYGGGYLVRPRAIGLESNHHRFSLILDVVPIRPPARSAAAYAGSSSCPYSEHLPLVNPSRACPESSRAANLLFT